MSRTSQKPVRPAKWNFAILTYGNLAETKRCLKTLAATVDEPFAVFVVDNGSTDGTREWLQNHPAEWLHWRLNDRNRGVPGGRNDLLAFAVPHLRDDDWLVFCDNDLEFVDGWLQRFRAAMARFPEARMLGQVGHCIEVRGDRRVLLPAPIESASVDVLSGGFACTVRVDAAKAIGPFDEQLGLFWHEDDDWSVRALQKGFELVAVPDAGIVHHEHATGVATKGLREGGSLHNQRYLVAKWKSLGLVDDGGWIRRPSGPYQPPEVRAELQRRCRRALPIGRAEFAAAFSMLKDLVEAVDPARAFAARRAPLPSCWNAWLDWNEECAREANATELRARLALVRVVTDKLSNRAVLQPRIRVPDPEARGPAGHGLIASSDFDDPEWLAVADELEPLHAMRDPHARDRVFWEQVSIALSLLRAGALTKGSRVLLAGSVGARLHDWLVGRGVEIVEFDTTEPRAPRSFDVVIADRAHSPNAIAALATAATDTAWFAFSGDVVLDGCPTPSLLQPMQLRHELGPRAGLVPSWPIRTAVDPSIVEACSVREEAEHQRPQLSVLRGRLLTSFVYVGTRTPAPAAAVVASRNATAVEAVATIGVDLRTIAYADSTARGIGHYAIHHLAAVAQRAPELRLACYVPAGTTLPAALRLPNVVARDVDDFDARDCDLVHLPDPMNLSIGFDSPLRVFRHERTTVTFHDLTPLVHYVASWPAQNREAYLDRVRQVERSRATLLCNSKFTADDAIARLGLEPTRVVPVLAGLHGARGTVDAARQRDVRTRLGLRGPFVLHVGALDPHKNFAAALSAFLQVRGRRPLQLVVVGAVDPGIAHFAALCAQKGIPDVVFTGYLPRADLDALYAQATALLFLSKSEGFGFPLLEAMAAGCPVIGSDATSHPEVVGEAGVLVPLDSAAESAAKALLQLLDDPRRVEALRQKGYAQAKQFAWADVADRTLAVWRRMLSLASTDVVLPRTVAIGSPSSQPELPAEHLPELLPEPLPIALA